MIKNILVPLDGSMLAECVLPHVCAIAQAFNARITLLHIVTLPDEGSSKLTIDAFDWLLKLV
ncbi:MAG TPA: universal stress protein [Anaerolineales bacterium]|nr:universal stress protein [Anaerolineales bacterium]